MRQPQIVAYGGGVNSTAMLVLLRRLDIVPDLITFADTGGERPETYQHIHLVSEWCSSVGFPEIVWVRKQGRVYHEETLEENCLRKKMLPSIAYGYKTCSHKYKIRPQDMFCNNWGPAKDAWKAGLRVVKFIGFDADEPNRATITADTKYVYRYPLIENDMGREECRAAIESEGLPIPPKSSCFFCPHSKKHEIWQLHQAHPELMQRALEMEKNATLTTVKGLGRGFSWKEFIEEREKNPDLFDGQCSTESDLPCGCYDG